ncbi:MAG: cellulase family glycosylhydrolase [Planctomycetota bacterium]
MDGTDFLGPGPLGPPFTAVDFAALAALGANYVNISHSGLFTESPPYVVDPGAEANLDALVQLAEDVGLFCVICFRTGPGRSEFAIFEGQDWFPQSLINNTVWTNLEAQLAWAEMWRYTADRYKNRANVVGYDLMVEPNGASTIFGMFDPAEFYAQHEGSLADWNQMYPSIVAAIREVDVDTPILISAMAYGSLYWLQYLAVSDDSRVVYTVHHYEPFAFTHQGKDEQISYPGEINIDGQSVTVDLAWLQRQLSIINEFQQAHAVPVAINEFGVVRWSPGAGAYYRDQTELFEERGINHAIWLWESSWPPLAESDDFNFRHGDDAGNHADTTDGELSNRIRENWALNTLDASGPR